MDRRRRLQELKRNKFRTLLLVGVIGLGLLIAAIGGVIRGTISYTPNIPEAAIYGTWVEQNVPDYDADKFTVNKDGITSKGRMVSSSYEFNGKELTYQHANLEYRYLYEKRRHIMKRVSPQHYESWFHKK